MLSYDACFSTFNLVFTSVRVTNTLLATLKIFNL